MAGGNDTLLCSITPENGGALFMARVLLLDGVILHAGARR
jgi:hypothetical protein